MSYVDRLNFFKQELKKLKELKQLTIFNLSSNSIDRITILMSQLDTLRLKLHSVYENIFDDCSQENGGHLLRFIKLNYFADFFQNDTEFEFKYNAGRQIIFDNLKSFHFGEYLNRLDGINKLILLCNEHEKFILGLKKENKINQRAFDLVEFNKLCDEISENIILLISGATNLIQAIHEFYRCGDDAINILSQINYIGPNGNDQKLQEYTKNIEYIKEYSVNLYDIVNIANSNNNKYTTSENIVKITRNHFIEKYNLVDISIDVVNNLKKCFDFF